VEGINGAGKSMLASLAADHLLDLQKSVPDAKVAVLSAYYDFKTAVQQRCADMIGGMLKQFLPSSRRIHPEIRQLYSDFSTGKRPSKDDLFKILLKVIGNLTVFLIIDALDECSVSNRNELEDLIREIQTARDKSADIRLLATSRPNELNEKLVGGVKTTYRAEEKDVLWLLEHRIGRKTVFIPDETIWKQAKKQVASTANGMSVHMLHLY